MTVTNQPGFAREIFRALEINNGSYLTKTRVHNQQQRM